MKSNKNFFRLIRLGMFLLLGCVVSTTVFAKFTQKIIKMKNEINNSVIKIEYLDALNKAVEVPSDPMVAIPVSFSYGIKAGPVAFNLTPQMGLKSLPLSFFTNVEKIKITVGGYTLFLLGLPTESPEIIFRANDDNGFKTVELYDGAFRYPITSQCVPLINSKQMLTISRPIWPSGAVPVVNKTPLPVVITQKDKSGAKIGAPVELWTAGSTGSLKIQPNIYYLEINVGYLNIINLFSFKYNDPELSFSPSGPGVVMKDGTYTYFTMHPNAPIIKAP